MFKPGDIVKFFSYVADKQKYHLCISLNGHFPFLNSPKQKAHRGDFILSCVEVPCIPATESGTSIISCSLIVRMGDADLKHCGAERLGKLDPTIFTKLIAFIEASPVLSPDDKDALLDQLGDCA